MNLPPKIGTLPNTDREPTDRLPSWLAEIALLTAILLVAAVLRLVALGDVPPGPGYDELQNARLAERILAGERTIYFSENFGQEPIYPTLEALSVRLLGWSVVALRLPGALLGVLAVLALYLVGRQLADRRVALLAAALYAVSFWPLLETRMALETGLLPPLSGLGMLFLARGLKQPSGSQWPTVLNFALAGLFWGGHVYAYTPGRVAPLIPFGALVYLALCDRSTLRRHWPGLLTLCLVTALVVTPLVLFLQNHPQAEQRLGQLSGPLTALLRGDPRPALQITLGTMGMFSLRGEPQWLYNIAERPVFDPITSLFFYVGLALCAIRLRDWRHGLMLLWLLIGLGPALISPPAGSFTHTLVAQPAVYLTLALGIWGLLSSLASKLTFDKSRNLSAIWVTQIINVAIDPHPGLPPPAGEGSTRPRPQGLNSISKAAGGEVKQADSPPNKNSAKRLFQISRVVVVGVALLIWVANAVLSCTAYFVVWASAPEVRELYQGGITAVAHELDAHDPLGPVAIGAPYVNYWHPWNAVGFDLALRREDVSVRWFNPVGGWVWPAGESPTTYYFPTDPLGMQNFEPMLEALFAPDAISVSTTDDFTAYRVAHPLALEERLAELETPVAWPSELDDLRPPTLPIQFGDRFALLGVEVLHSTVGPGDALRLVTYWQVTAADPAPIVAFVHLIDDNQAIWGQQDWLDVWPDSLMPGDRFVQVHTIVVNPDTPPGTYSLQMGLYTPDTLVRLPIVHDGEAVTDRVLLGPVTVTESG